MENIIYKAKTEHNLNKSEIISLLKSNDYNEMIFKEADNIREKYVGNEVYLRALIEFSNTCQKDCLYCGIRCSNKEIKRYNLAEADILECVKNAVYLGYKTIVLQSGENKSYSDMQLIEIIKKIKQYNVALTLSIGEKTYEQYKDFKKAGADRYLLRIETTDKELYNKMHPNSDFENRINCLKNLKKIGYEVGTGCLVGLPEQTIESLADDILFFKELNADMIGIGPLIIHPQTPLFNEKNGNLTLALKIMAITRLLLPEINIPATTAMETLALNGQILALKSGANVVMPNLTPDYQRKKYAIYPNKNSTAPDSIKQKIESIGRTVEMSKGNSLKWEKEHRGENENS